MTKAQQAVKETMELMIMDIGDPLTTEDIEALINMLRNNKHDSIWGESIRKVFRDGGDVYDLIDGLAQQGMDDVFTMVCILGKECTRLVLRTVK